MLTAWCEFVLYCATVSVDRGGEVQPGRGVTNLGSGQGRGGMDGL